MVRSSGSPASSAVLFVALCSLVAGSPVVAGDLDDRLAAALVEALPATLEIRHDLHASPELGNREFETAAKVAKHLEALGYTVETEVGVTGVVGVLEGGADGPVVAVRADMDALPVTETTDLPFKSTRRTMFKGKEVGVAHACGHDIHTSVAMGVATALAAIRDQLPGTVKFIFQPAEEGPPLGEEGGAPLMLKEGALEDPTPEAIFALHSFPDLAVGEIGYGVGATFAAVDQFVVHLRGRQSHGAFPHLSVDPIVMAAQAVQALQTIRSRNLPPLEPSVVTVGIIRGGERFNIIPEEVVLEGTVRTYAPEIRATVEKRMHEIFDGVARVAGGSYEMHYQNNAPATINDPQLTRRVLGSLQRTLGAENVIEVDPTMGGEDFAFFANEVPGFYFRLGVVAPGTESGGLHTPSFRADDSAVSVGMRAMAHMVLDYLQEASR